MNITFFELFFPIIIAVISVKVLKGYIDDKFLDLKNSLILKKEDIDKNEEENS